LPDELLTLIFQHVVTQDISSSLKQLKNCTLVCWRWKRLIGVSKLSQEILSTINKFTPEIAFGKAKWKKYFGEVGVEPSLPANIHTILESRCPFWPDKKVKETHMLALIPKTVNGEPLTLEYMNQLVQNPKQGNKAKLNDSWSNYRKTPVDQSYWVLMTRDVLPKSRNKYYEDQVRLIQKYNQRSGTTYEVSKLLDAAICILLEYVQSGTRLYSSDSHLSYSGTYTRCQEKGTEGQILLGYFGWDGALSVEPYDVPDGIDLDYHQIGISGCRKLGFFTQPVKKINTRSIGMLPRAFNYVLEWIDWT